MVLTVTVAVVPGVNPVTLTVPVLPTDAVPAVLDAVYVNLESKLVIEALKPEALEVAVPKVGLRAIPVLAVPETLALVVTKPVRTADAVTVALWPAVKPETVIGSVEPDATPFATVPAEVVTLKVYAAS